MKKNLARRFLPAFAAGLMTMAPSMDAHADYSKVVVFGDSLSDTHRFREIAKALFGELWPGPPSVGGRFCNGPVAVELLADGLAAPLQNYAVAGATTGFSNMLLIREGTLAQVDEYLNEGAADPKALHVIWAGGNDYFLYGMWAFTAYSATAHIQQAITALYNAGARYFFVPTMPDMSFTPTVLWHELRAPGYLALTAKVSAQFSGVLTKGLDAMRAKYPDAKIMSFDTLAFMKVEMDKARAAGMNVTDSCEDVGKAANGGQPAACTNPDDYMFWDSNHPTAQANRILANAWLKNIVYKP